MAWERVGVGSYAYSEGAYTALVVQEGEFWINRVSREGRVLDLGIWVSRDTAFEQCNNAIQKLKYFFDITRYAPEPSEELEEPQ